MGYMNPVHKMGVAKFAKQINDTGIDGVLIVDSPPEESVMLNKYLTKYKNHTSILHRQQLQIRG